MSHFSKDPLTQYSTTSLENQNSAETVARSARASSEQQPVNPDANQTSARAVMEHHSAKSVYRNNWISENLDRINLTMPKGKKEKVKAIADRIGVSVNAYINLAIDEQMERDTKIK